MDPKPQENVQKCQEFYHFRGRAALTVLCFNMRLNYKISTRVILIFLPLYLPSSSTLLMEAGAVYFIKILHQHFDDNDLWKKWFNFSCNNSSRAGTWNLQQDCHKEAYMIPSSKAYFQKFWECFKVIHSTLFKFFMISVIYCSAVFPPDLALILLEYTKIIFKN